MFKATEGMISVEEFARKQGGSPDEIIDMIRDGNYVGRKVGKEWFIEPSSHAGKNSSPSGAKVGLSVSSRGGMQEVVVTDIQMSFFSMIIFMVKWVIASIPALIILFVIFSIVTAVFGGVLGGIS